MTWTPDREALLKVLWAQGLSASQIAKRLGGVSRSGVIGKIHRMGLPKRGGPSHGNVKAQRNMVENGALRATKAEARPPVLVVDRSRETGASRTPHNIPFKDRTESSCLMFVGGESHETGLICGAGRVEGKPYCGRCARLAYLPPEPKRRAA